MGNLELKPCPFCGGEAHLSNWTDQAYVWCECGVKTEVYLHSGCVDKAIEAWNRRAERTAKVRPLEKRSETSMGWEGVCTNCGAYTIHEMDYCHNCGAKLEWK